MKTENNQFLININLQLHAEEPEEPETPEELEEPEEIETPETPEEPEEPETPEEPEPIKQDNVPLSKFMAEKKKRQELERALELQQAERDKISLKTDYINRGYPEYEAQRLAEKDVKQQMDSDQVKSRLISMDIRDLTKDTFYADAEAYADEIKEEMRANPRLTVKQAYMLIRGEARANEVVMQKEQLGAAKRRQVNSKRVTNSSTSTVPKNPFKLSDDDRKALEGLKKAMPDSNWTEEKYFKTMKT